VAPRAAETSRIKVNDTHTRADQILEAARDAFAEHGYDATSITEIAGRVGVVEATIYRHFDSKRALLHEVIRGFYEPLIESAAAGVAGMADPRERIRHLVRRHLRAMTEDRLLCRLVIAEARTLDDYYESEVADLNRRYTALVIDAVHDGVRSGLFRADVPVTMVRDVVYGSIEHLAWGVLTGRHDLDVDATATALVTLVLDGLTAPVPTGEVGGPDLSTQVNRLDALADRLHASVTLLEEAAP
jgi:AcrR family transcriptional regulator